MMETKSIGRRKFILTAMQAAAGLWISSQLSPMAMGSSDLLVRSVPFPEDMSLDDRIESLDNVLETKKMRRIIAIFKKEGRLVKTDCTNLKDKMVFKYYFAKSEDRTAFENAIKDVNVIGSAIKA